MKKKDIGKIVLITAGVLTGAFAVLHIAGKKNKEKNEAGIDDDNQYLKNSGGGKLNQIVHYETSVYERIWKPVIDKTLSFAGLVVLAPIYGVLSLAIVIDDPGPVLFKQKRVGKNKHFFQLHKFRSMKMSTPHDVPTHMLENPEQYITRVGRFLRKTSLDELPQIWDIFIGNMSIIGPRPALWNQDDLIEERDKYSANDINPGLTGWAQINGRDELKIPDKAKLDGDYIKKVGKGGLHALVFDVKCFLGTFLSVLREDGVVEGGTGELHKKQQYEYAGIDHSEMTFPEDQYQTETTNIEIIEKQKETRNKVKVLFLAQHFITLYSFRNELIQRLVNEGYDVYLSLPESEDNKHFLDMRCHIVSTRIDRRGVNPIKDLELINFYRKMIPQVNPDIIFSYTIKPNIYGCLVTNHTKYRQICNITGTGATFLENNLISKICKCLYKMFVKHCYKVFFQNSGDREMFIKNGLVGDNWDMLPGSGVNLQQFTVAPLPDKNEVNFIFIGRVMKVKGIDEFLEAAKRTKEKYPNANFYIAGFIEEGEYKEKVASYSNAVVPLGFVKDIKEEIKKCHCTILPSLGGEGVPNVLLESAAMGRICIGSRIPGTKDVIEDGKTGYLFEAGNVVGLVKAIEKVMELTTEERIAMGLAGRTKVEHNFNREIVVQKYMDEVEKL